MFFLSFTFLSRQVQNDAEAFATKEGTEIIDANKKQAYLDSVWNKPVVNILGLELTYKDIKEKELNLGLDLQGGMHMVMEISSGDLLKALSGDSQNPAFLRALEEAEIAQQQGSSDFVQAFYKAYQKQNTSESLAELFSTANNKEHISLDASDAQVLKYLNQEVNAAVSRSFEILRSRIDRYGVAQPNIQQLPGTNRIQVELPGVDNPERVRNLLQGLAQLEFWEVYEMNELESTLVQLNRQWISQHKKEEASENISGTALNSLAEELMASENVNDEVSPILGLLQANYGLVYLLEDTAAINQQLKDPAIQSVLPSTLHFAWEVKPTVNKEGIQLIELVPLKSTRLKGAALSGDVVVEARQDFDKHGTPAVSLQMNTEGARAWKRLTGDNINRRIAIVLDNQVYSAPFVRSEIPGGSSSISGNFDITEAKDLANILEAGKLPAPAKIVEEAVVGPSLGQDSIVQGVVSMLAGLGLVVTFMIAYYRRGGWVANFALIINIFFILGLLAQFGAALTLPGIAGIVLTIGMSVDANVLIFERIREELQSGRSLSMAIKEGYDKAYSSIIDSNVTTFLTGLILYWFGTGGIKGFAVVLMIGIVCSVFTAVFITRLILEAMLKHGKLNERSFDTFLSRSIVGRFNFDFIKIRRKAYAFSIGLISIGIVAGILSDGYKLGVDFKGGRSYIVAFSEPVSSDALRNVLVEKLPDASLEIKTYNEANQLKVTTSYLVDNHSAEADQQVESLVEESLQEFSEYQPELIGSAKVGATMADDVKDTALMSVIYALGVIFLYILIRFNRWQFGLGALVALFHDVLMIFAAFGLAGLFGWHLEIDQVFIAAMLTVIGYSINDTVVIFDRVREFSGKFKNRKELAEVLNPAINNTLSRTIITSLTVFFVVIILLLFGGEVLSGFSFSLLIGVIFGTYSSIFIASPVALDVFSSRLSLKKEQKKEEPAMA